MNNPDIRPIYEAYVSVTNKAIPMASANNTSRNSSNNVTPPMDYREENEEPIQSLPKSLINRLLHDMDIGIKYGEEDLKRVKSLQAKQFTELQIEKLKETKQALLQYLQEK